MLYEAMILAVGLVLLGVLVTAAVLHALRAERAIQREFVVVQQALQREMLVKLVESSEMEGRLARAQLVRISKGMVVLARAVRYAAKARAGLLVSRKPVGEDAKDEKVMKSWRAGFGQHADDDDALEVEWALRRRRGEDVDQGPLSEANAILARFRVFPEDEEHAHLPVDPRRPLTSAGK